MCNLSQTVTSRITRELRLTRQFGISLECFNGFFGIFDRESQIGQSIACPLIGSFYNFPSISLARKKKVLKAIRGKKRE